jgi:hypothetical protein
MMQGSQKQLPPILLHSQKLIEMAKQKLRSTRLGVFSGVKAYI